MWDNERLSSLAKGQKVGMRIQTVKELGTNVGQVNYNQTQPGVFDVVEAGQAL